MADGIEQIESRLAAYIDGELPESERAEIERYLASNPGHLQMIQELRMHKQLLAGLPRESAPAEILDHLQSHLERQALLENVENDANMLRINRWPQWGAIAATLFLAVGLGVLVFSVLPGGFLNQEDIAIAPPSIQNLPTAPSLDESRESGHFTESLVASPKSVFSEDAVDSPGRSRSLNADPPDTPLPDSPGQRSGDFVHENTEKSPAEGRSFPRPSQVIIVSTDDPLLTRNLLAGYLGQNHYDYVSISPQATSMAPEAQLSSPAPATLPVAMSVDEFSSESNDSSELARANEQGLIVRNVSRDDLQKIQQVINSQRGTLQHARLVHLAPSVSADNQPQPTTTTSIVTSQEATQHARSSADSASSTTMPAHDAQPRLWSVDPGSNPQQDSTTGINAHPVLQATTQLTEPLASSPETLSGSTTDVMIIVRRESFSDAPTIPSTLPASSQPVGHLPGIVVPTGSTNVSTPVETATPATHPSLDVSP